MNHINKNSYYLTAVFLTVDKDIQLHIMSTGLLSRSVSESTSVRIP